MVIEDEEVFATWTGFALVVKSFATHVKVDVDVNAGEIPEITAEFDARVAMPPKTRAVAPPEVFAQVVEPDVAPQNSATGTPAVVVGSVIVPVFVIVEITGAVIVGVVRVLFVKVCVAARVTTVPDVDGNVIVVESVPAKVNEFEMAAALPFATVIVPLPGVAA